MRDLIHCAIGDIHGEFERLVELHESVFLFVQQMRAARPIQFIHLGDLVDRGPDSCSVVEYLRAFEPEGHPASITLRGNHEQMMADAWFAVDRQSSAYRTWLRNGGDATEASYAGRPAGLLAEHIAWMRHLPTRHIEEQAGMVFVHAGVDPDIFPACNGSVHMWTRRREFMNPQCWTAPALHNMRVIHGHTPTSNSLPDIAQGGQRVNIDTGAVYGGRLTAMLIDPGKEDVFLYA